MSHKIKNKHTKKLLLIFIFINIFPRNYPFNISDLVCKGTILLYTSEPKPIFSQGLRHSEMADFIQSLGFYVKQVIAFHNQKIPQISDLFLRCNFQLAAFPELACTRDSSIALYSQLLIFSHLTLKESSCCFYSLCHV